MQQVKKTTHKDLLKEYKEKRLRAIAREQEEDLRRIQEMKKNGINYLNGQPYDGNDSPYTQDVGSNGVPNSINQENIDLTYYNGYMCEHFITNPYNLDDDQTKRELLASVMEKTEDEDLRRYLEVVLNDDEFDMSKIEITNLEIIDCLNSQDADNGSEYSGEDLAMQLYNERKADEDLKRSIKVYAASESFGLVGGGIIGFLAGGPIGGAVGVLIGLGVSAIPATAEAYDQRRETLSMDRAPDAGIYYQFEVSISETVPVQKEPFITEDGEPVDSMYYLYYYDMDIIGLIGPNTEEDNSLNKVEFDSVYMESPIAPKN